MQFSVAVRNAMLDAIEATIGASPKLRLYTGAMPANCAAARAGVVLVDMALPADFMAAAAAGSKALAGAWSAAAAAAGLAAHYAILDSAGNTFHEQGLVSQPWVASTAFALGQQVHNGGNVYKVSVAGMSAAAGGPAGTGAGIVDGSITWDYVGPQDMALDNTNLAAAQTVSITSKTLTAPNA